VKSRVLKIILFLIGLCIAIELLLRTALFTPSLPFDVREKTRIQKRYVYGVKNLLPCKTVYAADKGKGIFKKDFIKYRINCLGYRGEEFSLEKKEDEFRVVILGGSHVFDINAFVSDGINGFTAAVCDSFLAKGINLNFINAGVPGQDIKNIVARLKNEIPKLKPDIVIINSTYNDLRWIPPNDTVSLMEWVIGTHNMSIVNPLSDTLGISPTDNRYSKADVYLGSSHLYRRLRDFYWYCRITLWQKKYNTYIEQRMKLNEKRKGFENYAAHLTKSIALIKEMNALPVLCIEERLMKQNPNKEMLKLHTPSWFPYTSTYETIVIDYATADSVIRVVSEQNKIPLFDVNQYIGGKTELFGDNIHTTAVGSREMAHYYYRLLLPIAEQKISETNE